MHIAVDVGGTFTDLVVRFGDGAVVGYKSPSTRPDITDGVFEGLSLIAKDRKTDLSALMANIQRIDFGTTIATNAILENKAARTGLLITRGFRDTLLVREGGKDDSYDIAVPYPAPYIPRSLTFEVDERITAEGKILKPLDEQSVRAAVENLRRAKVEAVAISLIWSITNAAHERRVAEIVRQMMPEVALSLGHEVNPCVREYRRTIAVALDASLKPLVARNVERMQRRLAEHDFKGTLTYITSNGGKASAADILKKPVYLCFSGPSAAPEAGRRFAALEDVTSGNLITVDMGGTSFDVSITTNAQLPMHREGSIGGHLFGVPSVEVHTVGSGGGSIARVDSGGFVHVGPESASSFPGPACYGRGGERATVTDANLVAGSLNARFKAAGGMRLSREQAEAVVTTDVGRPLGIGAGEAAGLIVLGCEQSMIGAIEDLTIKRGIDPREYVMVAGGAAAGAHAVSIAREIGIAKVIVPKMAGVLSAFGILTSDIRFSFARSMSSSTDAFDSEAVTKVLDDLAGQADRFLDGMSVPGSSRLLEFSCEARYRGQVWQLTVPFDPDEIRNGRGVGHLTERFHALHAALYSTSDPTAAVEITEWNVQAIGRTDDVDLPDVSDDARGSKPVGTRRVYFKELKREIEVPVYGPGGLGVDRSVDGPVLIDESLTTIVVGPGATVRMSRFGNYVIDIRHDTRE